MTIAVRRAISFSDIFRRYPPVIPFLEAFLVFCCKLRLRSTMTEFSALERAAPDVISILQGMDDFFNARIAVIGGMVLEKYLVDSRATEVS